MSLVCTSLASRHFSVSSDLRAHSGGITELYDCRSIDQEESESLCGLEVGELSQLANWFTGSTNEPVYVNCRDDDAGGMIHITYSRMTGDFFFK
jgi:hypothetical protein